jgi:ATP-dependent exoDNAse (exonuclease V) beta subunit
MLNDSQSAAVKINYEKLIECEKYVAATRARNELIITYMEDESK